MNKKVKYICAQPNALYYIWQIDVMLNNFINNGVSAEDIDILIGFDPNINNEYNIWHKFSEKYNGVRFYFYTDKRESTHYIPSIYFNLIKQHFDSWPELHNIPVFCHDSDIIFTKPLDFSELLDDKIWYFSDTNRYINYEYLVSKDEMVYNKMCDIVGINPIIPKILNSNSGGAQHIIKGATAEYWHKVEMDSIKLYDYLTYVASDWPENKGQPIQTWTAGMWSLLWNAWLFGFEVKVDKKLDFCWPTDNISKCDEVSILHNSGVLTTGNGLFYKGDYMNAFPYHTDINQYDKEKCTYRYVEEIVKLKNNYVTF